MNLRNTLLTVLTAIVVSSASSWMYTHFYARKTGYIDSIRVFNEFKMKKELESNLKSLETTQKNVLDSIALYLRVLDSKYRKEGRLNADEKQQLEFRQQQYLAKEKEFRENKEALVTKYDQQIWTRINAYVKEYGERNSFSAILGAKGDGTIMYAEDAQNVTEGVLAFIEQKYAGK